MNKRRRQAFAKKIQRQHEENKNGIEKMQNQKTKGKNRLVFNYWPKPKFRWQSFSNKLSQHDEKFSSKTVFRLFQNIIFFNPGVVAAQRLQKKKYPSFETSKTKILKTKMFRH
uniref:Ribosomal protein S18 n=1 Tax=Panagrolaimus sp. JU765 TaxID=591449 RepID=A0AC34PV09_9BILA